MLLAVFILIHIYSYGTAVGPGVTSATDSTQVYLKPTSHLAFPANPSPLTALKPGGVSSGLKLWLKADAGVSSDINSDSGQWNDQSGNGNHATNSNSNLSNDGSGTPKITNNTSSSLINYNPNLTFNYEQLKVNLDINPSAIGTMDIYVIVNGNNSILGNESGSDIDRSIAPNRVSNGVEIKDYFFSSSNPKYNDQLKIFHYSFGATSNANATSYVHINGKLLKTFTESNSDNGYDKLYIGNAGNKGSFSGQMAEVIIYDKKLNSTKKNRVDSYLSLKYGISLDNSTTSDYYDSDGTVIFDASANSGFTTGVFGLGRDDDSTLDQRISKNGGSDLLVSLQNDFSLANNHASRSTTHSNNEQFLIISNNGESNTSDSTDTDPEDFQSRFRRVWKVNLSGGFNQDVALRFDAFGSSVNANERYLLTDDDGDFSNGGTVNEGVLGTNKIISGVRFSSSRPYFTIGKISTLIDPTLSNFNNQTKTYAAANFTYGAPTSNSSGSITYSSSNPAIAIINSSTGLVEIKGVGSTVITANQAANSTYKSGSINATLTVTKAGLTIIAANKTKTYDRNTFSGFSISSTSGFRSGESVSNLSGSLSYSGTAITAVNAGTYTITPAGYSSSNYNISYTNGTLTIGTKPLSVSGITALDKTYDGNTTASLVTSGMEVTGVISGDSFTATPAGIFSDAGVGVNKTVNISYTKSGSDANNYTLTGQTTTTASISGANSALDFDGSNDYVNLGDSFGGLSNLTIEYWVYVKAAPSGTFVDLLSKDYTIATALRKVGSEIYVHNNFGNGTAWKSGKESNSPIPLNTWTHISHTRNSSGVEKIYINGDLDQTASSTFSGAVGSIANQTTLGAKDVPGAIVNHFNGQMEEVRVWNTVRSQQQIQENMYESLSGSSHSGLLSSYHFNDGAALTNNTANTTLYDQVGSTNGTLNGFNLSSSSATSSTWVDNPFPESGIPNGYSDKPVALWKAIGTSTTRNSHGLTMTAPATLSADNYVNFATSTSSGTTRENVPSSVNIRSSRIWYVNETGNVSATVNIGVASATGQTAESFAAPTFVLLKRSGSSGDFSKVATASRSGDLISFPDFELEDGYYSIGIIQEVTLTANANQSKVYGASDPVLSYTTNPDINSKLSGALSRSPGEVVGTYSIGIGTISNSQYSITYNSDDFEITSKTLTITGITAADKVYDGNTTAAVSSSTATYDGLVSGDNIGHSVSGVFDNKNVGTNKTVTLTNTFSGADASNYTIVNQTSTTASVTLRSVSITPTASQSKAYGAADPTPYTYTTEAAAGDRGLVVGDSFSGSLSREAGEAVGTYTFTLGTLTNSNYSTELATEYLSISSKTLTITGITAADKVYDGNTTAAVSSSTATYDGLVSGDNIGHSVSGIFDNKNVGTNKTVTLTNTFSGADASNYSIVNQTSTTASVTLRSISITPTASQSKAYGATDPTPFTYSTETAAGDRGLVAGDSFSGSLSREAGEAVGTYTFTLGTLTNSNYSTELATEYLSISSKTLTITGITAADKVYDGNTAAAVSSSTATYDGLVSGDNIGHSVSGVFDNKNVGTNKTVTLTNTFSGADASNYTIVNQNSTTASVTLKTVTGTLAGSISKLYDNNTTATLNTANYTLYGFVTGENASVSETSGTYETKNVGTGKTVSVSLTNTDYTPISGTTLSNYILPSSLSYTLGVITSKTLTITGITAADKVYDGNTAAAVSSSTATYDGLVSGDNIGHSVTGVFDNKNVGTNKTVTLTNTFSGADASNYSIVNQTSTTASITGDVVYLSGNSGINKTYDDNLQLPAGVTAYGALTGVKSGDLVTVSGVPTYDSKNAGSRSIIQGSIRLTGIDATNYSLNWTNGSGTIFTRTLTVTAKDDAKFVTQTDATGFKGVSITGFISDDNITDDLSGSLSISRTNTPEESPGIYTNVLSPTGYTATNYEINYVAGDYTIVAADQLLVDIQDLTQTYGTDFAYTILSGKYYSSSSSTVITLASPSISAGVVTFSDGVGGQAVFKVSASGASYSSGGYLEVGSYPYTASDITETSANFSNIITLRGTLEIQSKTVTATAAAPSKTYDTTAAIVGTSPVLSGALTGDALSLSSAGSYLQTESGSGLTYLFSSINLEGTDASNYNLVGSGTLSGTDGVISKAPLSVTANNDSKIANGVAYSGGNGVVISGFVGSENISALGGTISYGGNSQGALNAGTYQITPSGYTATNYDISFVNGTLSIAAGDTDSDGILDVNDNCPTVANPDQADLDSDGIGDACDADIDGDGFTNTDEASCGTDPRDATDFPSDLDGDLIPDCVDPDRDGDGILNARDNCPDTPNTDQADLDGDGAGDVCDADMDGDGFSNTDEIACGTDPRDYFDTPLDTDNDGIPDCSDTDDDNDGQSDEDEIACGSDPFLASSMSPDIDLDGIPDCLDPDIDGDGCLNEVDAFPLDPNECVDTDKDGTGNNKDEDDDGDGQMDVYENQCGSDSLDYDSMALDTDGDMIPDCMDEDDDNDGYTDLVEEACGTDPLNANDWPLDTDSDGILNCDDLDDDGDGQSDTDEIVCGTDPLDANSFSLDTDGDGITDCFDPDIDGDGCLNEQDAFPFDPTECVDTDLDGMGNNSDLDDDGDGQTDADELSCGSDPLNALSLSEDLNEDGIPDCVKPFDIEISQLLTPKEFGQESVWELKYITAFPNSEVKVYNRHKQLVFDTKNYQNDWSGTHKNTGAYLPAGPYYYVIQVNDGRQPTYTGWLYITY